jgi:dynein heavy chain 1
MVGDALPQAYDAAVAFVGGPMANNTTSTSGSTSTSTNRQPLQCVTLQPSLLISSSAAGGGDGDQGEEGAAAAAGAAGDETKDDDLIISTNTNSQATLLQALQLYSRNLFLPVLKEQPVLQDKIRELNVAIGQSQRSAKLPSVTLHVEPKLLQAVSSSTKVDKTNVDWSALGLSKELQDDDFLNTLQSGVGSWITEIRKLTVLPKSTPFPMVVDSTDSKELADLEEIAFWNQLSEELHKVQEQLSSPGVEVTLAMLRETKRFVATLALQNNTGLEQAVSYTQDVQHFLKTYPAVEFQSAGDLEKVSQITNAVFDHFPKVRQSRYYGLERTAQLLSASTLTIRRTVENILLEHYPNLLFMDYKEYELKVRYPTQDVFVQFQDRFEQFKEFFLEQGRRRKIASPAKILEQLQLYHKPLEARLDAIHDFRSSHERLRQVVIQVLQDDESATGMIGGPEEQQTAGAIQTVEGAPRLIFSSLNVLDLSPGGQKAFDMALEEYDLQMDAMEERLAKLLRDKLTACQDAEDMFRVFARFNPLLSRTRVRVAVKEFQVQLIATVAQAVEGLQTKLQSKYETSSAAKISKLRFIPPVSGKIMCKYPPQQQLVN